MSRIEQESILGGQETLRPRSGREERVLGQFPETEAQERAYVSPPRLSPLPAGSTPEDEALIPSDFISLLNSLPLIHQLDLALIGEEIGARVATAAATLTRNRIKPRRLLLPTASLSILAEVIDETLTNPRWRERMETPVRLMGKKDFVALEEGDYGQEVALALALSGAASWVAANPLSPPKVFISQNWGWGPEDLGERYYPLQDLPGENLTVYPQPDQPYLFVYLGREEGQEKALVVPLTQAMETSQEVQEDSESKENRFALARIFEVSRRDNQLLTKLKERCQEIEAHDSFRDVAPSSVEKAIALGIKPALKAAIFASAHMLTGSLFISYVSPSVKVFLENLALAGKAFLPNGGPSLMITKGLNFYLQALAEITPLSLSPLETVLFPITIIGPSLYLLTKIIPLLFQNARTRLRTKALREKLLPGKLGVAF